MHFNLGVTAVTATNVVHLRVSFYPIFLYVSLLDQFRYCNLKAIDLGRKYVCTRYKWGPKIAKPSLQTLPEQSTSWGLLYQGIYKGKYHKNVKLSFDTLNFIWGAITPYKSKVGQILILLDPHNLSVGQKLPFTDLSKMTKSNGK